MVLKATNLYEVEHFADQAASFRDACMKGLSPEREAELAGMTFEGYDLFEMRAYAQAENSRLLSSDTTLWGALLKLEESGYSGDWEVFARRVGESETSRVGAFFKDHQPDLCCFLPEFDDLVLAWEIHHSHNVLVEKAKQWLADQGLTVEQLLQESDA